MTLEYARVQLQAPFFGTPGRVQRLSELATVLRYNDKYKEVPNFLHNLLIPKISIEDARGYVSYFTHFLIDTGEIVVALQEHSNSTLNLKFNRLERGASYWLFIGFEPKSLTEGLVSAKLVRGTSVHQVSNLGFALPSNRMYAISMTLQ